MEKETILDGSSDEGQGKLRYHHAGRRDAAESQRPKVLHDWGKPL